jgi:WD40 repeat protein
MSNLEQSWKCIAELRGHTSWVYGVPITPKRVLASISGSQILLWDLDTQKVEAILEGHNDTIFSLSLSPDGKTLASGSIDKTVGLWNLETRKQICSLAMRKDPIHSVAFSSDGKLLAAGGENKYKASDEKKTTIYIWDIETRELANSFQGHDLRVNTVAFSPDNKVLASGSNDGHVKLWDINSGKELYSLNGHDEKVSMVAFTPNGKQLISSGDGGIKVWDLQAKNLNKSFAEGTDYINCFALHPSGELLAFGIHEGIEIWNLNSATRLSYLDFMWPTSMSFSFDGRLFASGDASAFTEDDGGLVKVWNVPSEQEDDIQLIRKKIEESGYFEVNSIEDVRQRIIASIVQRQGQSQFRQSLLEAYNGRCPITGCDVESALEAAHIIPYQGTETNHLTNGLLLRADMHTLFDLHLLSIQPKTYEVVIVSSLLNTCYSNLKGKKLELPKSKENQPSQDALMKHYEAFLAKIKSL